jgi:lactate 2-monooxygenase
MYTFGSAGSSRTYRNNLEALERWRIIPRMLRNTTDRNLEVSCAYLLSAAPRADPIASLDHPLWC